VWTKTTYAEVSDFSQYLLHPENKRQLSFLLREDGYAPGRKDFPVSGWTRRREQAVYQKSYEEELRRIAPAPNVDASPAPGNAPPADPYASSVPKDPYSGSSETEAAGTIFDPATEQNTGIILGIATCSIRGRDPDGEVRDYYLCGPGDDVQVYFPTRAVRRSR